MAFVPVRQKATRFKLKASILVDGLSGNGKTGFALQAAYYLGGENFDKVGAVDTENNSMPLFIGKTMPDGTEYKPFIYYGLDKETGFRPSNYIACRDDAVKAGCTAFINDSISHAWTGPDGVLDLVTQANRNAKTYDKNFSGWNDPTVIAEKSNLIELIRCRQAHVISTGRVKNEYAIETVVDANGRSKTEIRKLGLGLVQDNMLEYEPDLVVRLSKPGTASSYPVGEISKSRYDMLTVGQEYTFTPQLWRDLRAWLEEGADISKILENQRQEYIAICRDILTKDKTKVAIWKVKKEDLGHKDTKIEDLPLEAIKSLYAMIVS